MKKGQAIPVQDLASSLTSKVLKILGKSLKLHEPDTSSVNMGIICQYVKTSQTKRLPPNSVDACEVLLFNLE